MTRRRILLTSAGLCACLATASAAMAAEQGGTPAPPSWIDHPKSDDSIFIFRVGRSEGCKDKAAAQQAAYENALSVIVNEMLARSGVEESIRPDLAASLPVQNAELVPGAVYGEARPDGIACWVQVSYPLAEKAKLLERIEPEKKKVLERVEYDKRISTTFSEARAAYGRGDYEAALAGLQTVLKGYAQLRSPGFALAEARILQGDIHGARKDFLAARQSYEMVAHTSSSAKWKDAAAAKLKTLPKAPRAWPLNDRWQARTVALLCAVRDAGQPPRPFPALGGVLAKDCQEARLRSVDVAGDGTPDELAGLFDRQATAAACAAAKRKDAGVVLAVLLTVDTSKRGQTQDVMGVAMPVMDAGAAFVVVDAADGKTLYSNSFAEMAGTQSESRLAERVAAILVERYLVPKCPALGQR